MLSLVKIWQVSSRGPFMQHLETCLLWQLKLTEFCVNLWWLSFCIGCTKWNSAAIRSLLLFMASLFIGFLVEKYVACQSRKCMSDVGWHRFSFHLAWWVRGLQSLKRYWPYLIPFRSSFLVCMIKTMPHSTVSPQTWCINGIKSWFTRTQICWQDFAK